MVSKVLLGQARPRVVPSHDLRHPAPIQELAAVMDELEAQRAQCGLQMRVLAEALAAEEDAVADIEVTHGTELIPLSDARRHPSRPCQASSPS